MSISKFLDIVDHPRAGGIALICLVLGAPLVGIYASQILVARNELVQIQHNMEDHVSKSELFELRSGIVSDVKTQIIKRDIVRLEAELRGVNQRIQLDLCIDVECRWPKAEKERLERQIGMLREDL